MYRHGPNDSRDPEGRRRLRRRKLPKGKSESLTCTSSVVTFRDQPIDARALDKTSRDDREDRNGQPQTTHIQWSGTEVATPALASVFPSKGPGDFRDQSCTSRAPAVPPELRPNAARLAVTVLPPSGRLDVVGAIRGSDGTAIV